MSALFLIGTSLLFYANFYRNAVRA